MSDILAPMTVRAIDLFCGAGGSSWGAKLAGVEVIAAFDAWDAAKNAYCRNFPDAKFYHDRIENVDPRSVKRSIGKVDLIIASPECTSHSLARGAKPRSDSSLDTAFQVARFAKVFNPRWIVIENVVGMRTWSKYPDFKRQLQELGYHIREQILNSADFGVPQRRRRLLLLCDRERLPSKVVRSSRKHVPASQIIDRTQGFPFTPLKSPRRAKATLERAERAIGLIGPSRSFLLVYYGSDKAGGWQRLDTTLRTITTLDRFALVKPSRGCHAMRMLQVPELKRAMSLPKIFHVGSQSRRESIHLIGNAVCPPVMRAAVRSLTKA